MPRHNHHHSSYRHRSEGTEYYQGCTARNRCLEFAISTVSSEDDNSITKKCSYPGRRSRPNDESGIQKSFFVEDDLVVEDINTPP